MNFIQLNKFSELHDGENIIFCKTDFIFDEFKKIEKIPHDVILITGNSDYPIDEFRFNRKPKNIKRWYAQNALVNDEVLIPIPIGIENKLESVREGHGIGYYDRVSEKEQLLSRDLNVTPEKFIYSNFNINTNFNQRINYKNISKNANHIEWEESNLTLESFFNNILEYKMVLCPVGNGIDTHRLWEVLYSGRIPITVSMGNYKLYDLYKNLPIIVLDEIEDLLDYYLIEEKYNKVVSNDYKLELIDYNYWRNQIKNI
jgi:hypothetical protein